MSAHPFDVLWAPSTQPRASICLLDCHCHFPGHRGVGAEALFPPLEPQWDNPVNTLVSCVAGRAAATSVAGNSCLRLRSNRWKTRTKPYRREWRNESHPRYGPQWLRGGLQMGSCTDFGFWQTREWIQVELLSNWVALGNLPHFPLLVLVFSSLKLE